MLLYLQSKKTVVDMPLINGQPIADNKVQYAGLILPQDKQTITPAPFDTTVNYAGQNITTMPATYEKPVIDQTNNPSSVQIGNTFLPYSVNILIDGEKIIAESQILDGVSVFEHVSRKAYAIEFKMKVYSRDSVTFPQLELTDHWNNIWLQNTVYTVTNTLLNRLGVQSIIIKSIKLAPRFGSTIVDLIIKCHENQDGQSIILTNTVEDI